MPTFILKEKIAENKAGFPGIAFSPDGSRICYETDDGCAVMTVSGGRIVEIENAAHPTWISGDRLLIERETKIVSIDADGSNPVVEVTPAMVWKGEPTHPAPSPDGKKMICMVEGLPYAFDKYRKVAAFALVENGKADRLDVECYNGRGCWTPDGGEILLWSWGAIGGKLSIVDVATHRSIHDVAGRWPVPSPNGERVAFLGDHTLQIASISGLRKDPPESPIVYTLSDDDDTPAARLSHNMPIWLDDETVVFEEDGAVYVPGKDGGVEVIGELEHIARRGIPAWGFDRNGNRFIVELESDSGGFELFLAAIDG